MSREGEGLGKTPSRCCHLESPLKPSSKPSHFIEKSPVHGPVHSPQSRFCSVPGLANARE